MSLGWPLGAILVGGVNALALIASSAYLAIQHDDILTNAAVQGNTDKAKVKALAKRLQSSGGPFKYLGPIRTAQLISHLSERARTIPEIELMAPHVANVWLIFRPEMGEFVGKFDRLLRLSREPASGAERLADVLTASTQISAATFNEMLDGLLAAYEPGHG